MRIIKHSITTLVLAGSLIATGAHAAETGSATPPRQAAYGAGAGALVGALAGGPAGAILGLWIGGTVGDQVGDAEQRQREQAIARTRSEQELNRLRGELLAARQRLDALRTDNRRLAQTEQRLQQLNGGIALDVLFRTGSSELEPRAQERLQELANLLLGFPTLDIQLGGHADRRGASGDNLTLSRQRAQAVKQALVAAGIPATRLHLAAHGEAQARAAGNDRDGLALDRRVSIQLQSAPRHLQAAN